MPYDGLDLGFGTLLRLIKSLLVDIFFDVICYSFGWFFLRVVTLGRYPESSLTEGVKESAAEETLTSLAGLAIILLTGYGLSTL